MSRWLFFIAAGLTILPGCFLRKQAFDMARASVYCEAYPAEKEYAGKVLQGTGFIIKHRNMCYFITCYHNIIIHNFYVANAGDPGLPGRKIRLVLQEKAGNKWSDLYIDLLKPDSSRNFYSVAIEGKEADIIAIPMGDVSRFLIEPVAIHNARRPALNEVLFIPGFPEVAGEKHIEMLQFGNVIANPVSNDIYKRFANYPLAFINRRTTAGFSGSPVYKWRNTKKFPVLVGVNAAADIENNVTILWRSEVVQKLLLSLP